MQKPKLTRNKLRLKEAIPNIIKKTTLFHIWILKITIAFNNKIKNYYAL